MSGPGVNIRREREPAWFPLVALWPYVLLAALAAFTVVIRHAAGWPLVVDLILCGVAAAWMLWMHTLHPGWRDRPVLMGVFVAGVVVITAVLVVRDPWFGVFTPAGYFYAFRLLRWPWELAGVAAVALVAGTAQASGIDKTTALGVFGYLAVLVINVVPMCGLAWLLWSGGKQDERRRRLVTELTETNRRLEASLSENASLHERLLDQARQAGVQEERQRMAREIHDTLAQGLAGIITQLQAAGQDGADPAERRRHLDAATGLARESLTEARRSVHALRPQPLQSARLADALADVASRWSALHDVPVQVTTTGTALPIRPEAEVALLRTAQEALSNVAKHAGAGRVGVTLSYLEHEVALDVRDDGRGFGADAPPAPENGESGGFGLIAMRQRIEGLAGTLQVESEPGAGTAVSARVPATPEEVGR